MRIRTALALILTILFALLVAPHASAELYVHFIDVGQGDAILLLADDTAILVDAGRYDRNDVVPYLSGLGIDQIRLFIGTHPDADHIGQCDRVLRAFVVLEVWMPGTESSSQTFRRCRQSIVDEGALYDEPRAGKVTAVGSLLLEVLHPSSLTGDSNNDSIVVRAIYGNIRFLLTGDAEAPAEMEMLERRADLSAEVLKAGHHGSRTSSTPAFVEAINPEIVVYSAGRGNSYGHPHAETVNLFASLGIPFIGTDQHGTIIIATDGLSWWLVQPEVDLNAFIH